ncbi:MAG: nicotinate-nucleotide adenylyltransferase [Nitrospiraceae bacterium]
MKKSSIATISLFSTNETPHTQLPGRTTVTPPGMRLGLLGGTFNPIHRCHLTIAGVARDAMQLDRILFVPTGDPPHKEHHALAPAVHREVMVRLALEGHPSFAVSDIELRRTGKSYSIDTVRALLEVYGPGTQLFLILGLDAFVDLPSWKEPALLLRSCHVVVLSRPAVAFSRLATLALIPQVPREALDALDAGKRDRFDYPIVDGVRLTLLRVSPCEVSASDIRRRIQEHRSVANLLPPSVESYIIQHGLYVEDSDRTGIQGEGSRDCRGDSRQEGH